MATVKAKTGQRKGGNPNVGMQSKERAMKARVVDELLKAHGCATVDDLKAKLIATGAAVATEMPEGPRFDGRKIVTGGKDALAFIDKDCPYVSFVSSTAIFVLRPERRKFQPPIERIVLKLKKTMPWYACPFYIGDKTNIINDSNLKVFKEEWHHFTLPKVTAEAIWADPRWEKPKTAVMDPETFGGWDSLAKQARGKHEPITDFVPLREVTRRLLQKGADTFMNWLEMPEGYKFDRRIPNPYRNRITDITVEFQSPRDFVAKE